MVLGQYRAVMVGTWWYWVIKGHYWAVLGFTFESLIVGRFVVFVGRFVVLLLVDL